MKRAFIIVLDSVGIGAIGDWAEYDIEPGNTICHVAAAVGGLNMPHLEAMGLGNIADIKGLAPTENPTAKHGKAPLTTKGKDTTAGHWEMMGIILQQAFPTYPNGFPNDLIEELENAFGSKILGKKPASGTAVIEEFGREHLKTHAPIVYTSGDSVVQIACHEDIYNNEKLYDLCKKARSICQGKHGVGRVIARPFKGVPGAFERTKYRKDFSLVPPKPNVLSALQDKKIPVIGVGKINDIFCGENIDISYGVKGNTLCLDKTLELLKDGKDGFYFVNLVDFDMLYGHRNDPVGYAQALEDFDAHVPSILENLREDDLLIITADHGNDPTTASTDHNREYVPVLSYICGEKGGNIGVLKTMSDIGATVYQWLTGENYLQGNSWLNISK
ncbi:MAG: phosphopentomutase [Clostridiales bacterium]